MSRMLLAFAAIALAACPASAQDNATPADSIPTTSIWAGVYTIQQAAQGQKFYAAACSECHGDQLEGDPGQGFPGLAGPTFMVEWDGQTMANLVRHIHTAPNDQPGDMDQTTAVVLAAFILNRNGLPPGKIPLSTDEKVEAKILFSEENRR